MAYIAPLQRIVIVGSGIAGVSAAAELRRLGYSGSLAIVSDEVHLPYDRPPLSKAILTRAVEDTSLLLQSAAWYAEEGIELVLGDGAIAIDRAGRCVRLRSGRALDYDKLLIATGARPRRLPLLEASGIDVHYLRSLDDSFRLRDTLGPGRRVAVIGAGVIGMEVAASAGEKGCPVSVIEAGDRIMARSVSPAISAFLERYHKARGVKIACGRAVAEAAPAQDGARLTLSDGTEIYADTVLVGIGAEPNTELARLAGLAVDDGVLVDAHTRTEDSYIHAIGDVARFRSLRDDAYLRAEHWRHAVDQAAAAAAVMLGGDEAYREQSWVWSDQYDLNIQIVGTGNGEQEVLRGSFDEKNAVAFQLNDGMLVGAITINGGRHRRPIAQLVEQRARLSPDVLADAAIDIGKLNGHVMETAR